MARRAKFGQPPPYVDHHSAKQIAWVRKRSDEYELKGQNKQKLMMKNEIMPMNYMQDAQGKYLTHA